MNFRLNKVRIKELYVFAGIFYKEDNRMVTVQIS